jgi:hypothetical protein
MRITRRNARLSITAMTLAAAWFVHAGVAPPVAAQGGSGTIKGVVKLTGPAPANPMLRLGIDPLCGKANPGKRPNQEIVLKGADGGLAMCT